jgi:hypothetical protein
MDNGVLVALFAHTGQGADALRELLAVGVPHGAIQVIGDLGAPAGTIGAMHHVTFDVLHIPKEQRESFMDGIRSGGVVLAVRAVDAGEAVEQVLRGHGALVVERTSGVEKNPSHNLA